MHQSQDSLNWLCRARPMNMGNLKGLVVFLPPSSKNPEQQLVENVV